MLSWSPNELARRVQHCLERGDPIVLDEVTSLHYDSLGYCSTAHAQQGKLLLWLVHGRSSFVNDLATLMLSWALSLLRYLLSYDALAFHAYLETLVASNTTAATGGAR